MIVVAVIAIALALLLAYATHVIRTAPLLPTCAQCGDPTQSGELCPSCRWELP